MENGIFWSFTAILWEVIIAGSIIRTVWKAMKAYIFEDFVSSAETLIFQKSRKHVTICECQIGFHSFSLDFCNGWGWNLKNNCI